MTPGRASLSDMTINGLRTVKKTCGKVRRATQCSHYKRTSSSNKRGTQSIRNGSQVKKKTIKEKRAIQDGEKQRLRDGEKKRLTTGSTEAGTEGSKSV